MSDVPGNGAGEPAPDANVSPTSDSNADAPPQKTGNEAESSPAVNDADDVIRAGKGVGKRIDELTRNWREAERREQALLQLLQSDRAEVARPEPQKPATATVKTLADFSYDESQFQSYLLDQATTRATEAADKRIREEQERGTAARRQSEFARREQTFAKSVDDYHEVTRNPSLPITKAIAEVVAESDEGPALAYYLGKNPDVAERIAALSPMGTARELGRIEAKLISEREKAAAKRASAAPPPPPKIEGTGDPQVEADPEKMTDAQFAKWRKKQIAQRH